MTPTAHIEKIRHAFQDLREGLQGLETFLLDWTDDGQEHHHTTEPQETPATEEPDPDENSFPYSFEDVRTILGPIAKDGGKQAIQNALKEVGATRLSDVDPKKYARLIDTVNKEIAS